MSVGTRDALLKAENLSKVYGLTEVLSGVGLCLDSGEIQALIGHNGSGKSTLIKILAGVVQPEPSARLYLDGEEVSLGHARSSSRTHLHFIHQSLNLAPALTGLENLGLGGQYPTRAGRIDWRQHEDDSRTALKRLGVEMDLRVPVRELSAVQQTTLAIARATSQWRSPQSVLVLDEPTASLPEPEVERLLAMLRHLASEGAGIIYVSHRLDEIVQIADSVTVLRDGRLVEGRVPVAGLIERDLVRLMLGADLAEPTEPPRSAIRDASSALTVQSLSGASLRGMSMTVAPGEILGIAGLNGSGREAVGRLLFGVDERTSGTVTVDGRTVRPTPRQSVSAGMAFVPADRTRDGCIQTFSVMHNVTLTGLREFTKYLGILSDRRERSDVHELMSQVGLYPMRIDLAMGSFSGGNQQKAVITKWLRRRPKVLIIEEPTQGVDVGAREAIFELIAEVVNAGMSAVVSSAENEDLARLCDRVLVLRRGRVACELSGSGVDADRISAECLAAV